MGKNLRDRLKRIKQIQHEDKAALKQDRRPNPLSTEPMETVSGLPPEWEPVGYKTLRRKVCIDFKVPQKTSTPFPPALAILIPDLFIYGLSASNKNVRLPAANPQDLVFFDLETTGLGGAGAVAFLAAFGRIKKDSLEITQYLLLDFPGESDFIEAVIKEFDIPSGGKPPLVVSYNGKSFDSHFLKTRCLINGFTPPEYYLADLLHPCRRLWKSMIGDCSQAGIEEQILGLDRTGDIPGSMAPDIWFSFLKTGETGDLLGICSHNIRDIYGLAKIFFILGKIAASPLESRVKFNCSIEALALRWRETLRRRPELEDKEADTAKALMAVAAKESKVRVLRILAMEAEWKNGDYKEALSYTKKILSVKDISPVLRDETLRRKERLVKKMKSER